MKGYIKLKIHSYRQEQEFELPATLKGQMVTDVSKEHSAFIFRVKRSTLVFTSRRGLTPQNTHF